MKVQAHDCVRDPAYKYMSMHAACVSEAPELCDPHPAHAPGLLEPINPPFCLLTHLGYQSLPARLCPEATPRKGGQMRLLLSEAHHQLPGFSATPGPVDHPLA